MSEANTWKYLKTCIGPQWEAQRHENLTGSGVADVSFSLKHQNFRGNGWIELKYADAWPRREATILRIRHFTDEQRRWLYKRYERGGGAYVFIQVGREFMLFTGVEMLLLGRKNKTWMLDNCCGYWYNRINPTDFLKTIIDNWTN